jgi:phosphatidylinositol alpha-1,6-mannosyltransferase
MRVAITSEQRFYRSTDGSIQTHSAVGSYDYWDCYRQIFDSVAVLARVTHESTPLRVPAEGPGVGIYSLPDYVGLGQYLRSRRSLKEEVAKACASSDALIARLPGAISDLAIAEFIATKKPFGVYVIGDPAEVFRRGVVDHPLRPVIRRHAARNLRRWCREATSVAYVTKQYLQQRYPPASQFVTHFSDVHLPHEAFAQPRRPSAPPIPIRLISVAVLSQRYKGIDVLLEAIASLKQRNVPCSFDLVGDGAQRPELERKAVELGIRDSVTLAGQLSDARAIREHLDRADLFILPSLTEGLPRALIEAMARGLPCVASSVGGVTELLSASDVVPPGDPQKLADKILGIGRDPEHLARASAANLRIASEFSTEATQMRRSEFCSNIVDAVVARSRTAVAQGPAERLDISVKRR